MIISRSIPFSLWSSWLEIIHEFNPTSLSFILLSNSKYFSHIGFFESILHAYNSANLLYCSTGLYNKLGLLESNIYFSKSQSASSKFCAESISHWATYTLLLCLVISWFTSWFPGTQNILHSSFPKLTAISFKKLFAILYSSSRPANAISPPSKIPFTFPTSFFKLYFISIKTAFRKSLSIS